MRFLAILLLLFTANANAQLITAPVQAVEPWDLEGRAELFSNILALREMTTPENLGWTGRLAPDCVAGTLNSSYLERVLEILNGYRALIGSENTVFSEQLNANMQEAILPYANDFIPVLIDLNENTDCYSPLVQDAVNNAILFAKLAEFHDDPISLALFTNESDLGQNSLWARLLSLTSNPFGFAAAVTTSFDEDEIFYLVQTTVTSEKKTVTSTEPGWVSLPPPGYFYGIDRYWKFSAVDGEVTNASVRMSIDDGAFQDFDVIVQQKPSDGISWDIGDLVFDVEAKKVNIQVRGTVAFGGESFNFDLKYCTVPFQESRTTVPAEVFRPGPNDQCRVIPNIRPELPFFADDFEG